MKSLTHLFDFATMWLHPDGIARRIRWKRTVGDHRIGARYYESLRSGEPRSSHLEGRDENDDSPIGECRCSSGTAGYKLEIPELLKNDDRKCPSLIRATVNG